MKTFIVSADFLSHPLEVPADIVDDLDYLKEYICEMGGFPDLIPYSDMISVSYRGIPLYSSCCEAVDENSPILSSIDESYVSCSSFLSDSIDEYEDDVVFLKASIGASILGGKGGFGAMLRMKSKQKGKKQTTDFGACRDLNGRRLRHVNDEILLQKWKEAKDSNEEFNVSEATPSGIDLWYLDTPTWSDKVKKDSRKRFAESKHKKDLCRDWLRARENGRPPSDAPVWWGCPRGVHCNFAHGEEELISDSKNGSKKVKIGNREADETSQYEDDSDNENDPLSWKMTTAELVKEGLRKKNDSIESKASETPNNMNFIPVESTNSISESIGVEVISSSEEKNDKNECVDECVDELPLDDYC